MDRDEVFDAVDTSYDGLTRTEADQRLERYGPNTLPAESEIRVLDIVLGQIRSPLIYVLIGAAILAAFLGDIADVVVILAVIVLNTIVGFIQEYKAEQALNALAKMVSPRSRVVRDGEELDIDAHDIVPGDVILLESGVRVPADARLFQEYELLVDESTLTGESLPVAKTDQRIDDEQAIVTDQRNMIFMGTLVQRGRGRAVVVATGTATVLGEVASQVKQVGRDDTPLQKKLDQLARLIVVAVGLLAVLVVILGLLAGETLSQILLTAVSMTVATVPEGLPVTVTVALAVGVSRMAQRHAIVRKLPAVETLGSTTVIGSDKTGTLTKNEMTVAQVYAAGRYFSVSGIGYEPHGSFYLNGEPVAVQDYPTLIHTLRAGLLANESELYREDGRYKADGDPTEVALIVVAEKAGLQRDTELRRYKLLHQLPFESDRQYMATLHRYDGREIAFFKGAPERILQMSTTAHGGTPLDHEKIAGASRRMAAQGLRVLAMAYREMPSDVRSLGCAETDRDLIFLGLQGLLDPPRPEAIEAIARAKGAGIRVVMITGDQRATAQAIAEKMGIHGQNNDHPGVLEGRELAQMTDEELYDAVDDVAIYARATPAHKLRIVQQLRRHGEIVAVTGDGVNDAPALRAADIGVAMGITGTDVAKEAAEIILTDDNFATIFAAIEEGRAVFDNIRKVVLFLIPTGISIVLTLLFSIVFGLPLPFLPAQVIWINLVTNGLQDVAMAFEPAESDIARRPPRDPQEGIFTRLMVERTILVSIILTVGTLGLFVAELAMGVPIAEARTVALTTMVLFQNFQIFNTRSFTRPFFTMNPLSNPFLFTSIVAALGLHTLALYFPPLQSVLRTEPLSPQSWLLLIAVASTVLWAVEVEKALRRRFA